MQRHTLVSVHHKLDDFAVPILKYTLLVGCSLLALIFVAENVIAPAPAAAPKPSTSLEVLRKMANHGEVRSVAPLAYAGDFLPVPAIELPPVLALADVPKSVVASPAPPAVLNAQARLDESVVAEKPARPVKKIAARKPKPRTTVDYVENLPRGPSGFFGALQSW